MPELIDPLKLEINLKNVGIIRQEIEILYSEDWDKYYPFVSRITLTEIIKRFEGECELIQRNVAELRDSYDKRVAKVRFQALKHCTGILEFCLNTIPRMDDETYNVYELIIAGLSDDVPQPHLQQQYDDTHLFQQSTAKKILAIDVLCIYFNEHLPKQTSPDNLLPILKQYIDKPFKFTALLIWSLKRFVTPKKIICSGVLHYFFSKQTHDDLSMGEAFNSVHRLLELYKHNDIVVKNLIFWTDHYSCGHSDLPHTSLSGHKKDRTFTSDYIVAAMDYFKIFDQSRLVIHPSTLFQLYQTFGLSFVFQMVQQSASAEVLKECIGYMRLNDFLIFLKTITQIETKLPADMMFKQACIHQFQHHATAFDQLIEHELEGQVTLSRELYLKLAIQRDRLQQANNYLRVMGYYLSWKLNDKTMFKKVLFEYSFNACVSNNSPFDIMCTTQIMMEPGENESDIPGFLLKMLLQSNSEALLRLIIEQLHIDPLAYDGHAQEESLFIKALKKSNQTLSRLIFSLCGKDKINHFLKKKNHLGHSIVHSLADRPLALFNLLSLFKLKDRIDKLLQRDLVGDTVAHWAADHYASIENVSSLLPREDRDRLFSITNRSLETIVHVGAENAQLVEFYLNKISITRFFKKDRQGNSVLHRAARCPESLQLILGQFPGYCRLDELDQRNGNGQNVVMLSVSNVDALKWLWEHYYKKKPLSFLIAMEDTNLNTLLHLAAPYTESFCFLFEAFSMSANPTYWNIKNGIGIGQSVLLLVQRNEELRHLIVSRPNLNFRLNLPADRRIKADGELPPLTTPGRSFNFYSSLPAVHHGVLCTAPANVPSG